MNTATRFKASLAPPTMRRLLELRKGALEAKWQSGSGRPVHPAPRATCRRSPLRSVRSSARSQG